MKLKQPKIEIKTKPGSGAFVEIYVDGHKLHGVRRFKLEKNAETLPILTVDLNALDLSVDTEVIMIQEGCGEIESIKFRGID